MPILRLGILGGGQLARMLALQAHPLGIIPHIYSESAQDPAAQVTRFHHAGTLQDHQRLEDFLRKVDVATFESEFVNGALLNDLQTSVHVPIFPHPLLIDLLQDRLTQKHLLQENKLATAPFLSVSNVEELKNAIEKFKGRLVLKARRNGYDGYGTFIMTEKKHQAALVEQVTKSQFGFIAEAYIPFRRELAIIVVREQNGAITFFPLVETKQLNNQCFWVKGPIRTSVRGLQTRIQRFLQNINYVGVIAFELFDTAKNLYINEIAPRVHNSGHYSIEALNENQFSAHVKAVMGLPMNQPSLRAKGFSMVNLLGQSTREPQWNLTPNTYFHWYGKEQNRPRRKLGHITCLGHNVEAALKLALKAHKGVKL